MSTTPKPRAPTRAELVARSKLLEIENGRLERAMAHLVERNRSLAILLERAEQDRDDALRRLATCAAENGLRRQALVETRALLQHLDATSTREVSDVTS